MREEVLVAKPTRLIRYLSIGGLAICLILSLLELNRIVAQDSPGPDSSASSETTLTPRSPKTGETDRFASRIRVNSNLVLIPAVVTDSRDRLITDLRKENFRLFDEKVEQEITHFTFEDAPVSIGIVLDCSGSMAPKLEKARLAIAEFFKDANPEDEFSLVLFNDRPQLATSFTDQIDSIQNRIMWTQARGCTALLDAVYLSLNEMRHAKHSRKAILIISDGGDNCSRYSYREVRNAIREADVQIFSIGILEPISSRGTPEEMSGPALLDEIAHETGGRLYEIYDLNEMRGVAVKISAALRHQYVLGYTPGNDRHDGKYHRVKVRIERPKGTPRLRISFRSGYYEP